MAYIRFTLYRNIILLTIQRKNSPFFIVTGNVNEKKCSKDKSTHLIMRVKHY